MPGAVGSGRGQQTGERGHERQERADGPDGRWRAGADAGGWVVITPTLSHHRRKLMLLNGGERSEEHTSELQSLMRSSYAVFCFKTNKTRKHSSAREASMTN